MENNFSFESEVSDLLKEAQEDYIGLWELSLIGEEAFGRSEKAEETSLLLVEALLQKGLLVGALAKDGHFTAWPDQHPDAVVDRIRREWLGPSSKSDVDGTVWFSLPR
jgi:hypothetical protein